MNPETELLIATAVHAGFQVTVTTFVYPALARTPAADWRSVHDRHSRAIVWLVAVVYGGLVVAGVRVLLSYSSGVSAWALASLFFVGCTWVATGFAARIHGKLGAGHSAELIRRLVLIDRFRLVGAVLALVAAVAAG